MDITSIRRRPNFDEFPRHFCVLFRCHFAGRKIHVISVYFFRCNFDGWKIHDFFMYFYQCILLVEKFTLFRRTFFDVICLVEICTLFLLTFFDIILMGNNSTSFLLSCKPMKTLEKVFPVFVTLISWLLQDCSLWIFQANLPGVAQFHWNLSLTTSTTAKRTAAS